MNTHTRVITLLSLVFAATTFTPVSPVSEFPAYAPQASAAPAPIRVAAPEGICLGCNNRPVQQSYPRKNVCYDTDMTGSIESGTNARLTDESSTMSNKYCEN